MISWKKGNVLLQNQHGQLLKMHQKIAAAFVFTVSERRRVSDVRP